MIKERIDDHDDGMSGEERATDLSASASPAWQVSKSRLLPSRRFHDSNSLVLIMGANLSVELEIELKMMSKQLYFEASEVER